jgi:hypothetical protein
MDAVPAEAEDQGNPLREQEPGSSTEAGTSPAPSLPSIGTPGAADASEEQRDDAAAGSIYLFCNFCL